MKLHEFRSAVEAFPDRRLIARVEVRVDNQTAWSVDQCVSGAVVERWVKLLQAELARDEARRRRPIGFRQP